MLDNGIEIGLIFGRTLGPLVFGWAPNHFVLGAQLAPSEKMLVCIPDQPDQVYQPLSYDIASGSEIMPCNKLTNH